MEPQSPQPDSTVASAAADAMAGESLEISGLVRFAWVFSGAVLPVVCFYVGMLRPFDVPKPHSLSGVAALLLSFDGSLPLLPLLLICMGSILELAARPQKATSGWIRLGVFSGVVLSIEYWSLFQAAYCHVDSWSALIPYFVWGVIWSAVAVALSGFCLHAIVSSLNLFMEGLSGCAMAIAVLIGFPILIFLPYSLLAILVLCLLCSTPWAVAAYVSAAIWLVRHRRAKALQFTLWQLLAAMTWMAVHFALWRSAILMVLARSK